MDFSRSKDFLKKLDLSRKKLSVKNLRSKLFKERFQNSFKVAPFKLKFSRMSKSNSSTRSNSVETPGESEGELNSPQKQETNVPAILESTEGTDAVPSSPPPSYEHVLEEVFPFFSILLYRVFIGP